MILRKLQLRAYRLAFRVPFPTAHEVWNHRRGYLLDIEDETGRIGYGEAAPLLGFGTETMAACRGLLAACCARLTGATLDEADWPELAMEGDALRALRPAADLPDAAPAAGHALETALLDLLAQRAGHALAATLTPRPAGEVAVNATLGATDPDEAARQARTAAAAGFGTLKIKAGVGGLDADLARVRAVRNAVGHALHLRVDVNGAWTERGAAKALDALALLGVEYLEQPLPPVDVAAMARLRKISPIAIAADEGVVSGQAARRLIEQGAADVLVLKPMVLGGLWPTLCVARLARTHGVRVVLTTALDGAYGRTAALHAAAAWAAEEAATNMAPLAGGLATGGLLAEDLVLHPPQPRQGRMSCPAGPGLGLGPPQAARLQAFGAAEAT